MRKFLAFFICFGLSLSFCIGESDYRERLSQLVNYTTELEDFLKSNIVDFSRYDAWYNQFKSNGDLFRKEFIQGYKKKESFQLVTKALDGFSLAWGLLNQANYADVQYRESLTLEAVSDVHKWKSQANEKRKQASETITQAIDYLKRAKEVEQEE